jgi:D-alanyl-D-alanine carboxypeptidase
MRKPILLAFVAALMVVPAVSAAAAPLSYRPPLVRSFPQSSPPAVTAPSWILFDESTDTVIAAHNADEPRAIASVTKIMTGLLALERTSPDEIVEVSERAAATGEKEIELVAGERLTMDALFNAMMIHSANDAATAVAEHISGTVEGFVDLMNERAADLGLVNTSFANPHGLDAPGHYSSARDLLTLARVAMDTPGFAEVVRSKVVVIPPDPEGQARVGTTTDLMLDWYDGAIGIKTGFTYQALLTYVGAAERDGRRLYVVVLGSTGDRGHFADATALLDYGFSQQRYFSDVALKSDYTPIMLQHDPDPLVAAGDLETFMHLSSMGLTLEDPQPLITASEEKPEPITETKRSTQAPPNSVVGALGYWLSSVFGE